MLTYLDLLLRVQRGRFLPPSAPTHEIQVGTRTRLIGVHTSDVLVVPVGGVITWLEIDHVPAIVTEDLGDFPVSASCIALPIQHPFITDSHASRVSLLSMID